MTAPRAAVRKLSSLRPDIKNANKGTERGLRLLDDSLREDGAGRGILLDRNGNVIAGNKTLERAVDQGFEEIIIVPTDGKQLVATQRLDVDIDSPQGRRMALRDNRVGQVDLDWDAAELQALADKGVDLTTLWNENELNWVLGRETTEDNPADEWQGMPEFDQEDREALKTIKVHFASEEDMQAFAKLTGQTLTMKTKSIWYPRREHIEGDLRVSDES